MKDAILFKYHGESGKSLMHWSVALTKQTFTSHQVKERVRKRVPSGSSQFLFHLHSRVKMKSKLEDSNAYSKLSFSLRKMQFFSKFEACFSSDHEQTLQNNIIID